ncbi:hypothetical protein TeGR_g11738, partial [Tetraparma gracilis]
MVASIAMFTIDSPVAIGTWSPSLGFLITVSFGWLVHAYDRHLHRLEMSRVPNLRRSSSLSGSIARMKELGVPVEEQLRKVNEALSKIDMMVMPSTINNIVNARYIMEREKEIISVLSEAEPPALNFLATRLKLGLLFYKVKDHRAENGQHRTDLCELLAVNRISVLNVVSRATVLDALMMMKMTANSRAEFWVKNLLVRTSQDDLSE